MAKPQPGDRISVVSPSWAGPQHFPRVYDLGLERLRSWGLEPVETPTTRVQGTPAERARDLMAAFADPTTTGVISSIGGDDQIKVLRHLEPAVFSAHPKPFVGYSDNTNLHVLLASLGIPSFYGGAVMVQFARSGRIHPVTEASLRAALFTTGPWQLPAPVEFGDTHGDWATDDLSVEPPMWTSEPWTWHGPQQVVSGPLWGGCLEILDWVLGADLHVGPVSAYAGRILLVETSEEMPSADDVYRMLVVMGERGLLEQFAGIVFARPKAWSSARPTDEDRLAYRDSQSEAVLRAFAEYAPEAVVVMGVDAGHTDPMVVMPISGQVTLDPVMGTITVTY